MPDLTLLAAFVAGIISFLSPCVLPVVPAYLGQLGVVAVAGAAVGAFGSGTGPAIGGAAPPWLASRAARSRPRPGHSSPRPA